AHKGVEVERLLWEVGRPQLVAAFRIRCLVFASVDGNLDNRVRQAAVTGAVQARCKPQPKDRARARARDDELRRHGVGHRQVSLAAVLERRELELYLVPVLLTGPE